MIDIRQFQYADSPDSVRDGEIYAELIDGRTDDAVEVFAFATPDDPKGNVSKAFELRDAFYASYNPSLSEWWASLSSDEKEGLTFISREALP